MKTLCVDFDGVVHAYTSGWKGVAEVTDGPVAGAIEWLWWASERYEVCIYSSRSKDARGLTAMKNALYAWAREALMPEHADELMGRLSFPTQKPAAYLTIDDRAICFDGVWPTADQIDNFQPWYRRDPIGSI